MKEISVVTHDDVVITFEANEDNIFKPTIKFGDNERKLPLLLCKDEVLEILHGCDRILYTKGQSFEYIVAKCVGYFKIMGAIEKL